MATTRAAEVAAPVVMPLDPKLKALQAFGAYMRHHGWPAPPGAETTLTNAQFVLPIIMARAIGSAVRELGLEVRGGVHTGECEIIGGKLGGIAVHIGARVAAQAVAGEVLVSTTVRDLVAGSGLRFEDRGTHALKGVPGEWRLYAVAGEGANATMPS